MIGKHEGKKKRTAFVVIMERAVGAHLENKREAVLVEAGKVALQRTAIVNQAVHISLLLKTFIEIIVDIHKPG